ncbi:lipoprotein [Spiroplasma sp. DGKH1]|uniref:lipoprotein n=1 Tax=Spiroplasma sp. DGKH1 TaxID=3050074 RepID=UPI0034C5EE32
MKKILAMLGAISIATISATSVVACVPPGGGGSSPVASGIDLSKLTYDQVTKDGKLNLTYNGVYGQDADPDFVRGLEAAIQAIYSNYFDWSQVEVNISAPVLVDKILNLTDATVNFKAKPNVSGFTGQVEWKDVNLQPYLEEWLPASRQVVEVAEADKGDLAKLKTAATKQLFGPNALDTYFDTAGLTGALDPNDATKYIVKINGTSQFFNAKSINDKITFKIKTTA